MVRNLLHSFAKPSLAPSAPDRQHSMRCILISMWFVRCKLCRVHCPTLTSTHKWTDRYSAIEKHLETQHGNNRTKTGHLLKVLRKCNSKFDFLAYEMLYRKNIKSSLNTQADSIRSKLSRDTFVHFFFSYCVSYLGNYTHWTRKYFMYCFKFYIFRIYSFHPLYFFTFQLDNGVT